MINLLIWFVFSNYISTRLPVRVLMIINIVMATLALPSPNLLSIGVNRIMWRLIRYKELKLNVFYQTSFNMVRLKESFFKIQFGEVQDLLFANVQIFPVFHFVNYNDSQVQITNNGFAKTMLLVEQ